MSDTPSPQPPAPISRPGGDRRGWLYGGFGAAVVMAALIAFLATRGGANHAGMPGMDMGGMDMGPAPSSTTPDVPTYSLNLDGAEPLREETLTAGNTDVAIWGDGQGTYVSLSVRPGGSGSYGAPSGFGPMVKDSSTPEEAGDAWLSEPDDPRQATMWWVQPEGDLWILRAHWYGDRVSDDAEAELRAWAFAITTSGTADRPYALDDREMSLIASDAAGDKPSRSRVWSYDGHDVTLLVLDGSSSAAGLSNLLARGAPTVTEVPALGQVWAVGQTFGWTIPQSDGAWATLLVPQGLARDADAILRALTPE